MGNEYKIKAVLSAADREAITGMLEKHQHFNRKINTGDNFIYEFQDMDSNTGPMPDVSLIFETDGIYCCRYNGAPPLKSFEMLLAYLEKSGIGFQIVSY